MIDFINMFLSYIVLLMICVGVGTVGFSVGMVLKKKKSKKGRID